jgi:hypothetical protein
VWWLISVITAFGRLRQEDGDFGASLGYIVKYCTKTSKDGAGGIAYIAGI